MTIEQDGVSYELSRRKFILYLRSKLSIRRGGVVGAGFGCGLSIPYYFSYFSFNVSWILATICKQNIDRNDPNTCYFYRTIPPSAYPPPPRLSANTIQYNTALRLHSVCVGGGGRRQHVVRSLAASADDI